MTLRSMRPIAPLLLFMLLASAASQRVVAGAPAGIPASNARVPLAEAIGKPYLDLFELASETTYNPADIKAMREELKRSADMCVGRFKQQSSQYGKDVEKAQKQLKDREDQFTDSARHDLHCSIQDLRTAQSSADMMVRHAIPIAYDNRKAKLDLIEQWPARFRDITREFETGTYRNRRWGDVQDIGFRDFEPDQEKDIKSGQDAIREMKTQGLIPAEIENRAINDYVATMARKIAAHSDLKVPLKITLLDSKEINAFALPGGFLFVERGLLEAVDDEAELAGVLAHEMAHVSARHGQKLMRRAQIASIFFQAAQVAATVLTGGAVGAATYYALQYGFYGLGMVLDLRLLGVSRDYELQADQLGVQYAWNSDYDPTGFVRFFDKMATTKGYVEGSSWFYSHPPFFERMVEAEREIIFLPKKPALVIHTSQFDQMKKDLLTVTAKARDNEDKKPTLLGVEKGCAAAPKPEFDPGQHIEDICSLPGAKSSGR